ncbi:adenosine deaminase-like protein [Chiloscyllium plagiosum]|uniref:adenosine deaminase-like protein n=1 Tax=Chiloscyllium plagiosum TaxID=36176 RepID=UPI001CB8169E|nr:adenosine deaminase-like protein [Chiloscyllium plagiosum]XP_043557099.1 adenosine deaminase-like protein [Chiloscyllium plagiosum]XP_043557100.1 adenosine deaminase-like protein [Chiloscyllium plagiosum]XP_043557101.1 adenosine deaminase-like protein [Chiloscyllium plagiosum]XP_043557102.1 adenosine deaminase-like protein [Chiloscyllium plagiosum]XP_043557103.1 adenosine deaminase-like protein [Chiloscyllium plagiosum]XP_043557104.1 adenosine deaminase-like protein [Chiloscyllium plagiosu
MTTKTTMNFYQALPKVELHAHLNTSISTTTMEKLIQQKPHLNIQHYMTAIRKGQKRTMDECFDMFKVIHQLTVSIEDIFMVAKEVIKEFAADGVKYLELRSTPREESTTGMTKKSYVEAIIEAIKQCKQEGVDIDVKFLLSIDRRRGPVVAMETVKLAEEFFASTDGLIVGVDLSGDPAVEHAKNYIAPLQAARNIGLKLAVHMAEIPHQNEEVELFLGLPPDRIGHGTFLHPEVGGSEYLVDIIVKHQIPIELCLTSNLKGQTVSSYDQHHFKYWYNRGHSCVICTDGKGVFASDLSQEYQIAETTFNLSKAQIWDISYQSINHIFAPVSVKSDLKRLWKDLKPGLFNQYELQFA